MDQSDQFVGYNPATGAHPPAVKHAENVRAKASVSMHQSGERREVKLYYLQTPNPSPVRHYTIAIRSFTY